MDTTFGINSLLTEILHRAKDEEDARRIAQSYVQNLQSYIQELAETNWNQLIALRKSKVEGDYILDKGRIESKRAT